MNIRGEVFLKKLSTLTLGLVLAGTMSACSTSNVIKTSQAAPVTYKVGQKGMQYASLTRPPAPRALQHTAPRYSAVPQIPAMPVTPAVPKFDKKSVDRDLYAHQQVGKRYKIAGKSYTPKHDPSYDKKGVASWYGDKFHGKPTASGEIYDKMDLTGAHKTLPLNSMVHVTNLENGKSLRVRINDRGPFVSGRIIDLSEASAQALGITGLGRVRVQYAGPADPMAAKRMYQGPRQPAPMIAEAPRPVLPSPAPQTPKYTPLRELPQAASPYVQSPVPTPAPLFVTPDPVMPAPIMPQAPVPTAPQAQDEDDGIVTLTIKGPVHTASSRSTDNQPHFIPAVNYRTYKTKK